MFKIFSIFFQAQPEGHPAKLPAHPECCFPQLAGRELCSQGAAHLQPRGLPWRHKSLLMAVMPALREEQAAARKIFAASRLIVVWKVKVLRNRRALLFPVGSRQLSENIHGQQGGSFSSHQKLSTTSFISQKHLYLTQKLVLDIALNTVFYEETQATCIVVWEVLCPQILGFPVNKTQCVGAWL